MFEETEAMKKIDVCLKCQYCHKTVYFGCLTKVKCLERTIEWWDNRQPALNEYDAAEEITTGFNKGIVGYNILGLVSKDNKSFQEPLKCPFSLERGVI